MKIHHILYQFIFIIIYAFAYASEPQDISISSREIVERLTRIEVTIQETQKSNEIRFDSIDKRLDSMDKRLDSMDKRLDSMDKRLDGMDKRFDSMDKRLDLMDKRLDDFKWVIGLFLLIGTTVIGFMWRTLLKIQNMIHLIAEKNIQIEQHAVKQPEYNKLKSEFQLLAEKVDRITQYLNIPDNNLASAVGY
ncbi:conserved hypothetical protein, membrane [Candidatus Magnetomorum sp. HK-1]|nr:conserved hypothetical protein, membrane [Candidatus Magnetomorum sp. HK-1]